MKGEGVNCRIKGEGVNCRMKGEREGRKGIGRKGNCRKYATEMKNDKTNEK